MRGSILAIGPILVGTFACDFGPCPVGRAGESCDVCDVGYKGADCDRCVEPYGRSGQECGYTPTCPSDGGWLVEGEIAPAGHRGAASFHRAGTADEPTVIDRWSGLEWRACVVGRRWSEQTCVGVAEERRWPEALALCEGAWGGTGDWRVPSLDELDSLIDFTARDPAVDPAFFPGFRVDDGETAVWPASEEIPGGERGVPVFLGEHGHRWADSKEFTLPVLCVRGGSVRTGRRFTVAGTDGGRIRDDYTGQVWDRCPVGADWEDHRCVGEAAALSWPDADLACTERSQPGSPCRLPTVRELRLLRDNCRRPYTDPAAFPPVAAEFWTSTPFGDALDDVRWMVRMSGSVFSQVRPVSSEFAVRCVCE